MKTIIYDTKKLKCFENNDGSKMTTTFKNISLLMEEYNETKDYIDENPDEQCTLILK